MKYESEPGVTNNGVETTGPSFNTRKSTAQTIPGASSNSPWQLPAKAWWQIAKRIFVMAGFHNLNLLAAGVAFFTFLAITPLIAATVMIYGLIGNVSTVERQMETITQIMPGDVASVIESQLLGVVTANAGVTGFALAIALFFAIFGGMRAAKGLVAALNVINEERETRGIVKVTVRAALLTFAGLAIAITGLLGGSIFAWLQVTSAPMLGSFAVNAVEWLTWIAAMTLATTGFAVIMRFGPDRSLAQWRWLIPGALLSTTLFLAISFGFSLYVAYVSDYNAMYGSLSAVVVFLMWLFLATYGILIGALLNAEAERQTFEDSTVGPDLPLGERGAVLADTDLVGGHSERLEEKKKRRAVSRLAREASKKAAEA